jgi:hypothetical protein
LPFDLYRALLLPSSFLIPTSSFCLSLHPPPAIGRVQRDKDDHREIDPAAPGDVLYWQSKSQP